jgi:hypothetical protein
VSRFTAHLGLVLIEDELGRPDLTADGRCQWFVVTPLTYEVGAENSGQSITVPPGATTDLASIPRLVTNLFPPDGPWVKAAVVHDDLYRKGGDVQRRGHPAPYTRAEADGILREAMAVLGVGWLTRQIIWSAVRVGGAPGWGS